MLDHMAISERFFSCYAGMSRSELAQIFGVRRSTITVFASKGSVPWSKLKYLSDSQSISWDWLIEGIGPKESDKEAIESRSTSPRFSKPGINRRFLSLYPNMTLTRIAALLGVTPSVTSEWKRNITRVPWERLQDAANTFGVRWDWLIDGREPKFRSQQK